mmetsp:Transcript_21898/g.32353  ORF Transcript_21898/g.32353 Transcript_21898/m.32353 type:complete len:245 (-) Transcript_21898:451-1185(-)
MYQVVAFVSTYLGYLSPFSSSVSFVFHSYFSSSPMGLVLRVNLLSLLSQYHLESYLPSGFWPSRTFLDYLPFASFGSLSFEFVHPTFRQAEDSGFEFDLDSCCASFQTVSSIVLDSYHLVKLVAPLLRSLFHIQKEQRRHHRSLAVAFAVFVRVSCSSSDPPPYASFRDSPPSAPSEPQLVESVHLTCFSTEDSCGGFDPEAYYASYEPAVGVDRGTYFRPWSSPAISFVWLVGPRVLLQPWPP